MFITAIEKLLRQDLAGEAFQKVNGGLIGFKVYKLSSFQGAFVYYLLDARHLKHKMNKATS